MKNAIKAKSAKANTKAKAAPTPAVEKPEASEAVAVVVKHGFKPTIVSGSQNTINRANSRTRIQAEAFNTEPHIIFTALQNAFMRDLKEQFGDKEFKRLDLNAGKLNRAIRAGHVKPISGDFAGRECTFKLTDVALKTKYV